MNAIEQEKEIQAVRKAWKMKKPEYNVLPRWFTSAVGIKSIAIMNGIDSRLVDHWGTVTKDGQRVAVFEPYESAVSTDKAREIAADLANRFGFKYYVSLRSYWYPGFTIRVEFYK